MSPPAISPGKVGYVLKKYPRLSETFVLNELLGLERLGVDLTVYSLRLPDDGRFHADLARLRAPVRYLPPFNSHSVLDAIRALAGPADAGGLGAALAFVERLPAGDRASTLVHGLHLAGLVADDGIEHLHVHFMNAAAHAAHLAHVLSGVPYTLTAHAKDIWMDSVDAAVWADVAGAAAAVVTVCDVARDHVAAHLAPASTRVVRIYNGLPLEDYDGAGPVTACRQSPGRVVAVGRLVEKKGFDVLLEACAILARGKTDFECVIVGDGDQGEALRQQADRLRLGRFVRFVGAAPRHEVLRQLREATVLAAPFVTAADGNRDALPTVVLEAMALGVPVVASPVGGVPEMITHGIEGLLVPEGDVKALAAATRRLLRDPELGARMGEAGTRTVKTRFAHEQTLPALLGTFAIAGNGAIPINDWRRRPVVGARSAAR